MLGWLVLFVILIFFLKEKVFGIYGVKLLEVIFLLNIIDMELVEVVKSEKFIVVFLVCFDFYKCFWLFVEIVCYFLDVEFIFMGKFYF